MKALYGRGCTITLKACNSRGGMSTVEVFYGRGSLWRRATVGVA